MILLPVHGADDTPAAEAGQFEPADGYAPEPLTQAETIGGPSAGRKVLSLREIKERDELLSASIKRLKMTAPQIHRFSRLWQHPFYDERDVWRRAKAIKLDRRVRHVARQSLHDQWTLDVFIKIASDAARAGHPMYEIAKEHRIGESSRIRADMKYRIASRRFYQETQQSSLTFQGWKAKLGKYVAYRKRPDVPPFRVLIVFENEHDLNTALGYAREVMKPYPNLSLFLFAWMPDLLSQYNTVTEDVWRSHRYEAISLL